MTSLAEVVRALARREGVGSVVLVSADGLPIDQAANDGGPALDAETTAALTATLLRHAAQLGADARCGELRTVVSEFAQGTAIVSHVGDGTWLLVVARPDVNVGALLYDLRRHRPAIAGLL